MTANVNIGAPGIYYEPAVTRPALADVRMDVCAFLGVAPRGPAREALLPETWRFDRATVTLPRRRSVAVAVESFDEYRRLYGGFEGPGRLPYAVAAFFAQGGRRAYVVRIVHDDPADPQSTQAVALGLLIFSSTRLPMKSTARTEVTVESQKPLSIGGTMRFQVPDLGAANRTITAVADEGPAASGARTYRLTLERELPGMPFSAESVSSVLLRARSEGSWGNRLRAAIGYTTRHVSYQAGGSTTSELDFQSGESIPRGSLLRLKMPNAAPSLRWATEVRRRPQPAGRGARLRLTLDAPLPEHAESAELIEGVLVLDDGDGRSERHEALGLCSDHSRWLATVLCNESQLAYPDVAWADGEMRPLDTANFSAEPVLESNAEPQFAGGVDRYEQIDPNDFFDPMWVLGDADPGDGICALTHLSDLSSVVLPDLYCPEPLTPSELPAAEITLVGGEFQRCVHPVAAPLFGKEPPHELYGLLLDPNDDSGLERIIQFQSRAVELADTLQSFVVLLDVPPDLRHRQILRWASRFDSSYVAAYHPWLWVAGDDDRRDALIRLNPSAAGGGIIARQEIQFGVPHGPANVIVEAVVDVDQEISPALHDELHLLGINVFLRERDGVRLTAGRTLSRDARYRQLTVRRLMLMLRRALYQQTQWIVFEPNGPRLWADVRLMLRNYLRRLYQAGAFKGAREEEAFFVRCNEVLNPPRIIDSGQLIVEVGIAPTEPIEFIVLRITRDSDGALTVET